MSDDLQNVAIEPEVIQEQSNEEPITGTDLEPVSEAGHEEQPQVDSAEVKAVKAQQATQEVINKKHREKMDAERKTAQLQSQLDEINRKEQEKLAASVANIPDLPVYPQDAFDDNYEQQVANYNQAIVDRDAKIQARANFDANQNVLTQQTQYQQQVEAQAKQVKLQESMTSYSVKATELGINQSELQAAGNTVAQYGLSDDLVMHILTDSDGPLITKHLAEHPQDGYQLAAMNPYGVGAFLDGIKTKASALKPKTTNAPKPTADIRGGGAKPDLNKFPNSGRGKIT